MDTEADADTGNGQQTALDLALDAGQLETAQRLADAGMKFHQTSLYVPTQHDAVTLFKSMVEAQWPGGIDPRPGKAAFWETPPIFDECLIRAVQHGSTDVYNYLVNCGTSLAILAKSLGMPPLEFVLRMRPRHYSLAVHMLKQGLPQGGKAATITTPNPPASLVCLPTMRNTSATSHIAAQTIGEHVVIGQAVQVDTGVVIGSNVLLCNSCHICAGANVGSHVVVVEHAVVDVDVVIPSNCIVTTKGFFENRNGQPGKRLGDARRDKPTPGGVDPNPADKGLTGTPFVWMRDNQAKKQ